MAFAPIERGSTPTQVRDNLVKLVNDRFDFSEKAHYTFRRRLPRLYEVWRGIYTGKYHPHKNNVHVPLIYSAIWADAARKVQASLSGGTIVQFRGYGPDDKPFALKNEALYAAQWNDAEGFIKAVDQHVLAGLYGTCITKTGWDRRTEHVMFDEYDQNNVRRINEGDVVTFDGWNEVNVDLLDWYPEPGRRLISQMKWCGDREYQDLDDIREKSRPGPNGEPPLWDPAEVARMERESGYADKVYSDVSDRKYMARLGMSDDIAKILDKFSRPVELRHYWGMIPSEMAINGCTNVVITVANRRYLLRARGNPHWTRRKPYFAHSPTPDPQGHFAPGKAEIAEKLQLTANRYVNQRLDATDFQIDPQILYDRNSGINTDGLYSKPGRWIGTDGPPGNAVFPLPVDLRGIQAGAGMTAEMSAYIERAMGIGDDVGQGLNLSPDRETAFANRGRQEAQNVRIGLETLIFERQFLEPKANFQQRMNRQYLEGPVEVRMIGDNAIKDPDTGVPITDTHVELQGYELAGSYSAHAIGASSMLSRYVRRAELVPLMQTVFANPATAGAVNAVNFVRQVFREYEFDNVNELLNQNQGALAATLAAGGISGAPGSVPEIGGDGASLQQVQNFVAGRQ